MTIDWRRLRYPNLLSFRLHSSYVSMSGCSLGRSLRVLRRYPWSRGVPRRPRGSPAFHSHPTLPPGVRTYQLSRTHRRYLQVDKIQLLRLVNAMYCTVATGTPMKMTGKASPPTALELTRMIATARLVLPTSMVRLSAGRMGFTDAEQVCGLNSLVIPYHNACSL